MRLDHPIFNGPLDPGIELTQIDTPQNYRSWPGGKDLADTLTAWRVQNGEFPQDMDVGLVSDSYGFEDSPDAEWISSGVNSKGPTSMALGRHGNLFLWVFSGHPGQMTGTGRRVFLNSVVYMKSFDGQRPLVQRAMMARDWAFVYVGYLEHYAKGGEVPDWLENQFPKAAVQEAGFNQAGLTAWFKRNLEFLRPTGGGLDVDPLVKELGVSNRRIEFLDALVQRLDRDPHGELARKLLKRYVGERFADNPASFHPWLQENRDYLFFSDVGGFRWFVNEPAKAGVATGTR